MILTGRRINELAALCALGRPWNVRGISKDDRETIKVRAEALGSQWVSSWPPTAAEYRGEYR